MSNISRSVYQKLKEENKSLINDIKILVERRIMASPEKILVISKWRNKFDQENKFNDMLKEHAKSYIKNNPDDPAVKAFHKINEKIKNLPQEPKNPPCIYHSNPDRTGRCIKCGEEI